MKTETRSDFAGRTFLVALLLVVWPLLTRLNGLRAAERSSRDEQWIAVAVIGGMDQITSRHIRSLMTSNSIDCAIYGSLLYAVEVAPANYTRATQCLLQDPLVRSSNIGLVTEARSQLTNFSSGQLKTVVSAKSYQETLVQPGFSATTDLGRFLRNKTAARLLTNFPHIVSFSANQRRYLESTNRWANGYDVELHLSRGAGADNDARLSQPPKSILPVAVSGTIGESPLAASKTLSEPSKSPTNAPWPTSVRVHLQILSNGGSFHFMGGSNVPDYFR